MTWGLLLLHLYVNLIIMWIQNTDIASHMKYFELSLLLSAYLLQVPHPGGLGLGLHVGLVFSVLTLNQQVPSLSAFSRSQALHGSW